MGGHIVSGHADGVARLIERRSEGKSARLVIAAPPELMPFIASKGSVALNGVSLTVNEVARDSFGVNLIPYTLVHTSFGDAEPGRRMNLEIDPLARYVARLIAARPVLSEARDHGPRPPSAPRRGALLRASCRVLRDGAERAHRGGRRDP